MAYNSKRNIFPLWGISAFNIPAIPQYSVGWNSPETPLILLINNGLSRTWKIRRIKNKQIHTKKDPVRYPQNVLFVRLNIQHGQVTSNSPWKLPR